MNFEKNFEFTFEKENIKHLSTDYVKWSNKLSDLQELMRQMVLQINEKKAEKKLKVLNIALLFNFKKSK